MRNKKPINIRVNPSTIDKLKAAAEQQQRTITVIVENAILAYLNKEVANETEC